MLNTITRPDKGFKHVQRRIRRDKKGLICELRMKPTGLLISELLKAIGVW